MIARKEPMGFRLLPHPSGKTLITNERAVLPCGCSVYVGLILGSNEGGSGCVPCSPAHVDLIMRFQRLWLESLEKPTGRPAVDVAAEYLTETAIGVPG